MSGNLKVETLEEIKGHGLKGIINGKEFSPEI
jgi:hypothetical protein